MSAFRIDVESSVVEEHIRQKLIELAVELVSFDHAKDQYRFENAVKKLYEIKGEL